MKPIKGLNLKSLEKRITKSATTKDALRDVTPFTFEAKDKNTKIIVDSI